MTPPRDGVAAPRTREEAILGIAGCWSLVRGRASGFTPDEWNIVFQRCVLERCAPLAWARSQALIEAQAPRDIAVKWASVAWQAQDRVPPQLAALRELSTWLGAHNVPFVLLKGLPLGQRLYGAPWARPTDDMDLYIAPELHELSLELFLASGWSHFSGEFPGDLVLRKVVDGQPVAIDVHFTLGGPWHQHLPFPEAAVEQAVVEGVSLPALGGALLPVYLASHLMQHARRPLLWLVDFWTLLQSLDPQQREAAESLARQARLHRVFARAATWARELERLPDRMERRDEERFIRTTLRPAGWRALANILLSSASARDVMHVCAQIAWPQELRGDLSAFLHFWKRRLSRRVRRG